MFFSTKTNRRSAIKCERGRKTSKRQSKNFEKQQCRDDKKLQRLNKNVHNEKSVKTK